MDYQGLREKYEIAGQGHVFTFFEELSAKEKEDFLHQLAEVDVEQVTKTGKQALEGHETMVGCQLEPLPKDFIGEALEKRDEWYQVGLDLIKKNQVAVILMAGGQGTRLGSADPKGCYNIGLPSQKSLFQLQAERIYRLQKLAASVDDVVIPWYIMTSGPTDKPTRKFFAQHNYFGLKPENVIFFEQGIMPCFTFDGKFMLESKGKVMIHGLDPVSFNSYHFSI
jgi:UDP-N-acetylglucosamine/UDP-N-acetylgalactosamine diphosphorylase